MGGEGGGSMETLQKPPLVSCEGRCGGDPEPSTTRADLSSYAPGVETAGGHWGCQQPSTRSRLLSRLHLEASSLPLGRRPCRWCPPY